MCHDGQGVKISSTFFNGGDGDEVVGWKDGFVVKCSHMKKSAEGEGPELGFAGSRPVTPVVRAGKGPRGTVVRGAEEDHFCCWARTKDIMWDPLEEG